MSLPSPVAASRPVDFVPIGTLARVRLAAAACLPGRYPGFECGVCAEACPTGAIGTGPAGTPQATGDCLGCGQCASACPSGALRVEGFALPESLPADLDGIRVDCWRVARADSAPGTVRVPCLAGIGAGWLLALCELAGERPVHLLDRRLCGGCPAGAGIATLLQRVTEARGLLFEAGVPVDGLPAITAMPPRHAPAPAIPEPAAERRVDRRGFFRGLVGGAARGAEELGAIGNAGHEAIVLRGATAQTDQFLGMAALRGVARRHGRAMPTQRLPQVTVGPCSAHGICAKVCPTGALELRLGAQATELRFEAARCISCGQCARTCPDSAIRLQPSGGAPGVEVVMRREARQCASCGSPYTGSGGPECPGCLRNQQLFKGMAALFRPHA